MDKERIEAVKRWLIKADHDLIAAKVLSSLETQIMDVVCFHAQQCIEKSLKAFLVHSNAHVEKTHDVLRLLNLCSLTDKEFDKFKNESVDLADYAVAGRYPEDWLEITSSDAAEAVKLAEEIMGFVRRKVGAG